MTTDFEQIAQDALDLPPTELMDKLLAVTAQRDALLEVVASAADLLGSVAKVKRP